MHTCIIFVWSITYQTKPSMKKLLRGLGVTLLVIIAVPFIAAFFVRKDYSVERTVHIDLPRQEVFDYVVMLRNQNDYSVWSRMDPETEYSYRGTDGTVGFVSGWSSTNRNTGKGEQEITAIVPGERIDYRLRFFKPFRSSSDVMFLLEDDDPHGTLVHWGITGRMNYPMNVFLLLFPMEKSLGDDLTGGLDNLKELLER
jgi:uncharacterized protein YndB with AHSA1/START domain